MSARETGGPIQRFLPHWPAAGNDLARPQRLPTRRGRAQTALSHVRSRALTHLALARPIGAMSICCVGMPDNELCAEIGAKNPTSNKIHASVPAFRTEQYTWHQVNEATYDNFQIRQLNKT